MVKREAEKRLKWRGVARQPFTREEDYCVDDIIIFVCRKTGQNTAQNDDDVDDDDYD